MNGQFHRIGNVLFQETLLGRPLLKVGISLDVLNFSISVSLCIVASVWKWEIMTLNFHIHHVNSRGEIFYHDNQAYLFFRVGRFVPSGRSCSTVPSSLRRTSNFTEISVLSRARFAICDTLQ